MKDLKRRQLMRNAFYSALVTSVRASVIGVPSSFLLSGNVAAQTNAKFTILSQSRQGEPINCSGPGTFTRSNDSAASLIDHPTESELGTTVRGSVNGVDYSAKDLSEFTELSIGGQRVLAAKPWGELPQAFLDNTSWVWHRTGVNAHPEMPNVKRLLGACKDDLNPNREEEIGSAIAWDNADALGTALRTPLVLSKEGMAGFSKGNPLTVYSPRQVKSLFSNTATTALAPEAFDTLYSQTMDLVYANVKANGSRKQRAFLDNHALTRIQAKDLGNNLGSALDNVSGDTFTDQVRTAAAFLKLRVTPVVCISHDFAGDNHSDSNLEDETRRTLAGIDALVSYHKIVSDAGVANDVNLVTLDAFGRTAIRNGKGGRDHYGDMTLSLIHGSGIRSAMIGGISTERDKPVATGINTQTGSSANPDVPPQDTLAAYGKTIIKAAGLSDEKVNTRVPAGKVINACFS